MIHLCPRKWLLTPSCPLIWGTVWAHFSLIVCKLSVQGQKPYILIKDFFCYLFLNLGNKCAFGEILNLRHGRTHMWIYQVSPNNAHKNGMGGILSRRMAQKVNFCLKKNEIFEPHSWKPMHRATLILWESQFFSLLMTVRHYLKKVN